jgi:hypothetical protein
MIDEANCDDDFSHYDDGPPDPWPGDEGFEDHRREVFRTECRTRRLWTRVCPRRQPSAHKPPSRMPPRYTRCQRTGRPRRRAPRLRTTSTRAACSGGASRTSGESSDGPEPPRPSGQVSNQRWHKKHRRGRITKLGRVGAGSLIRRNGIRPITGNLNVGTGRECRR